ncbi:MAG: DUF192 domain-containing protein [Phycisphaerales bacterium]|nr:DUF192 domain-containing protein [Phycisphaerales bacterium]
MAQGMLKWAAGAGIMASILLGGCEDTPKDPNFEKVTINSKTYTLEVVANNEKRIKGLSGRTKVAEDGGMLFVFPDNQARVQEFVMRDCLIPIDIIFLDRSGRVTASHAMKVEEARKPDEIKPANPKAPDPYEARLKRYSSRYACQFVIELAGGELEKLKVKDGDKIPLDLDALKKRAS